MDVDFHGFGFSGYLSAKTRSDEEIAWGPITIREIKGDLKRLNPKPDRRYSIPYNFQMEATSTSHTAKNSENELHLCEEVADKLTVSQASTAYYTPNESLRTDSKVDFLEKLSKVINEPQLESSVYVSALENTKTSVLRDRTSPNMENLSPNAGHVTDINNTCLNFVKNAVERESRYDIANFQQTLVENSIISDNECDLKIDDNLVSSPVEETSDNEDSLCEGIKDDSVLEKEGDKVVIISDEEGPLMSDNSLDDSLSAGSSLSVSSRKSSDFDNEENNVYCEEEIQSASPSCYKFFGERLTDDMRQCAEIGGAIRQALPTIIETRSVSTSPVPVPNIAFTLSNDSVSKDDSLQLNDTLEEINRLVDQGLNYSMSDEESIIENTPLKEKSNLDLHFSPSNIISSSFSQKQPVTFFSTQEMMENRTPSKIPILEKAPIKHCTIQRTPDNNFKIPSIPSRTKLTIPTPPKSHSNHLKNVVSPVALYIKNSPCMTLKQKVPQRDLRKVVIPKMTKQCNGKENFPDFPEHIYKPSKKQIVSAEKEIVLPPSIKRLNVKEPALTKHQGRLNQNLNKTKMSRKLLDNDITDSSINSSELNNSCDISVLTNKQAFRK